MYRNEENKTHASATFRSFRNNQAASAVIAISENAFRKLSALRHLYVRYYISVKRSANAVFGKILPRRYLSELKCAIAITVIDTAFVSLFDHLNHYRIVSNAFACEGKSSIRI